MKPKTAKENINNLPDKCLVVVEVSNDDAYDSPTIGTVLAYKSGYHPEDHLYHIDQVAKLYDLTPPSGMAYAKMPFEDRRKFLAQVVDLINREIFAVTREQMEAMKWGSMFGWESPVANADYWRQT